MGDSSEEEYQTELKSKYYSLRNKLSSNTTHNKDNSTDTSNNTSSRFVSTKRKQS